MEYDSRSGNRYYFFEGRTKTGKPKYFVSRKETSEKAERIDQLPEGYEIFESPVNRSVTIRRCRPTTIQEREREYIEMQVVALSSYSVAKALAEGDTLVVYTPDRDPGDVAAFMGAAFGDGSIGGDYAARHTRYTAVLRFKLEDDVSRKFSAERFCFAGSIEDWIPIGSTGSLEKLAGQYLPTLGTDEFFELY